MRRFLIDPSSIDGERVAFTAEETHHLGRVLRLRRGDRVIATDGRGQDYVVRLDALGETAVGTILDVSARGGESPLRISLVQGIAKGNKMETIVRAATELGVVRVLPAVALRTVVSLDEGGWRARARRWQRVAREAAKQSRRAVVPEVAVPVPLSRWLRDEQADLRICLWEDERRPLGSVLASACAPPASVAVVVGPEGGLDPAEVEVARAAGWLTVGLGPRIMRTETAGPAAVAILQATFGDLGAS